MGGDSTAQGECACADIRRVLWRARKGLVCFICSALGRLLKAARKGPEKNRMESQHVGNALGGPSSG